MNSKQKQLPIQVVAFALVFGVGILIGQEFCAPPLEESAPRECPPTSPQIVEYCPPEPTEEIAEEDPQNPPEPAPAPRQRASSSDSLPEIIPPTSPQQRRQLLGWARGQAPTLQGCPRDLGSTYRLVITLRLNQDGAIEDVTINTDEDDLSAGLQQCLRQRILQWQIPSDLQPSQNRLVFQLTL